MFKPHFKEGTQLANAPAQTPVRIDLPDDKPLAMRTLCEVLHLQHHGFDPARPSAAAEVLDVALLCNKYQCQDAARLAAYFWLDNRKAVNAADRYILFHAAFYFREASHFRSFGQAMIAEDVGRRGSIWKYLRDARGKCCECDCFRE